jgi:DNA-binding NtrC family response regulator
MSGHGELQFEQLDGEMLSHDALRVAAARLLLVYALEAREPALRALLWLRDHRIRPRILVILPALADPALWEAATEIADDFLVAPVRGEEFEKRVLLLLPPAANQPDEVRARLIEEMGLCNLVGDDPAFCAQVARIPACAASDFPVLLTGETGTGKELFARAIHQLSRRRDFAFIPVDCGAVPDHLFENELFGHVRGAFTDAHHDQRGLIALASRGTLFLDEVDALSRGAQAKLLRFLQEQTYRPLGSERFLRADVKVIAATNCDIEECVEQKQFRSDLYYRINVLRLRLPSLRERPSDIRLLAQHFLDMAPCARQSFSPSALDLLAAQEWPGNVRQLLNVVQQAAVFASGSIISVADLPVSPASRKPAARADSFREAKQRTVGDFERSYVLELLEKHDGNVTKAAKEAGKDRRAFGRLVKKYRQTSAAAGQ